MNWLGMQGVAQVWVERVLNSLPEGLLIALFAWLLLRLIGRQNSGTRFAVWFMALLAIVGLLFFGGFKASEGRLLASVSPVPYMTIPAIWAEILFAVWTVVTLFALSRIGVGLWRVWAIRKNSTEVDLPRLDPTITRTFTQHGSGRDVRLAISTEIRVPAAVGFWKPAIVLPAWMLDELSTSELNPILIHELTHLKRCDDWTNLFQKIARAVFFFHPAVWWIDSRLSLEREMACDDAVLANTGNPHAYASSLIELLEKSCARRGWTMAQAAVHRAQELSLRIAQILDAKRPKNTRVWKPALALTSFFSLACFGISYCAPRLIAFAPNTAGAAATLPASDIDVSGMQGVVVPASFHVPSPEHTQHPASGHKADQKMTPQHEAKPKARLVALPRPKIVLTKAKHPTAPAVRMVVFVETAYVSYENQPETQVWQMMLIAPAQSVSEMGIMQSTI